MTIMLIFKLNPSSIVYLCCVISFSIVSLESLAIGSRRASNSRKSRNKLFNLEDYNSYDDIVKFLKQLSAKSGSKVSLIPLKEKTFQNRTLFVCKIGGKPIPGRPKPAIWIDAGLHAREWISISTALYWINKIANNKTLTNMLDWYILPVANPDGYEYTRRKNRDWRKNRSNCASDEDHCCGTDLNRNFNFDWGVTDSSKDACNDMFGGSSNASESETRAIQNFLTNIGGSKLINGYLTLHSYGQYWFYPYGHKKVFKAEELPNNYNELKSLAEEATLEIRTASKGAAEYTTGQAGKLIYPSSGGSDDWAKGYLGIRYVFCLELPPKDNSQSYYFRLPNTYIKVAAEQLWPGILKVVQRIVNDGRRSVMKREDDKVLGAKPQLYM